MEEIDIAGVSVPTLLNEQFLPKGSSGIKRDIEEWIRQYGEGKLYEVIALPDARSSSRSIKGLTFVCSPTMRMLHLGGDIKDFGGAVSIYKIYFKEDIAVESLIKRKVEELKKSLSSDKPRFVDTSLSRNYGYSGNDLTLGEIDCSIGIERYTDKEETHWVLVIRSYQTKSSMLAHDYIKKNQNVTIAEFYESDEYKDAVSDGSVSRNALALAIARFIDAGIHGGVINKKMSNGRTLETISPLSESQYNIISRYQAYKSDKKRPFYVFYRYAYGIKNETSAIPVGLGRKNGWVIYTPEDKDSDFVGSTNTFCSFPMGTPKNFSNEVITFDPNNVESINGNKNIVIWGSEHVLHEKVTVNSSRNYYEGAEGLEYLSSLGFQGRNRLSIYYPRFTYITSPSEVTIEIDKLLEIVPHKKGKISIPIEHEFCQLYIWPFYLKRKSQNSEYKITDLILNEDKFYLELNVNDVKQMLPEKK